MRSHSPVWHVYYLTRGTAGAYIDALQRAFNECEIMSRSFVSCRYRYTTVGVTKCFFPLSDRVSRRPPIVKALRGAELILAYAWILAMAAFRRPRINLHLIDDLFITYAFVRAMSWLRLPIDTTCHDITPPFSSMSERRLAIYRLSHRLIVHNKSSRQALIDHLGIGSSDKIVVYPFPFSSYGDIVSAPLQDEARRRLSGFIGQAHGYVLFVGVVHEKKGVETLLKSWNGLEWEGSCKLVIAGKWVKAKPALRALAEQTPNCVVIDRWLSDEEFVTLIENARCVVLPYTEYAHSAILHSCANYGIAVIVSDTPLFTEMLPDYALVFKAGDWKALRCVLQRVLSMSSREASEHRTRLDEYFQNAKDALIPGVRHAYDLPHRA